MSKKSIKSGFSDELKGVLDTLNKAYGAGTLIGMDDSDDVTIDLLPTGSLKLDKAIGGYPKGKIIEVSGEESLGKSTLALKFLAQIKGPKLYLDSESSLDREYAQRLGVDTSTLIISRPETIEDGITMLLDLVGMVDAVVFDSVAEFATKKEIEGDISDQDIGVKAKIMSKAIRKLKAKEHSATIMFINQTRDNPGNMYVPRVTPGGKALRYGCHLRIDVYGKELIKKGEDIIGHYMNLKIIKNKLGPPMGKVQIPLLYDGYGVSTEIEIIELAIEQGIVEKAGSWYKHGGVNIGQGIEQVRSFLKDNPEFKTELLKELK